jgi:hypothetical protein
LSFSGLPRVSAYNPVAYLYRQFVSFPDALGKWAVEKPDSLDGYVSPGEEESSLLAEASRRKKDCAKAIRRALGRYGDDFRAAAAALDEWCADARAEAGLTPEGGNLRPEFVPVMNTVWEINCTLRPLLEAYRAPTEFFCEIAPRLWSGFDLAPRDSARLAQALHTWGFGALLNPNVRAAFDHAASYPSIFARVLGEAEQRGNYREGRGKGVKDRPDVARRVSHGKRRRKVELRIERGMPEAEAAQDLARREGRSVSAIRKSRVIARKRNAKSSK